MGWIPLQASHTTARRQKSEDVDLGPTSATHVRNCQSPEAQAKGREGEGWGGRQKYNHPVVMDGGGRQGCGVGG